MKTIPVAIMVRVSTDAQAVTRQTTELRAAAEARGWQVVEVIEEQGISGASRIRPGLARALALAESGHVCKIMVHEISRLSRNPAILHDTVERLTEAGVSLYWHAQNSETLLPDGKRNPATGMMIAILGELARAEREILSERTRSGLAEARRKGRTLGRPKGTALDSQALVAKHGDVTKLLRQGLSLAKVAKLTGKAENTVLAVKRAMQ